ncbi:hypothetical protein PVNG_06339, partial [Plasmodium vivax North Korean]
NDKLENLPTKYNYYSLDKGKAICGEYKFYKDAQLKLSSDDGLQKVSEKILKAMCYMYTKKSSNQLDSEMCKYFYYWLGDVLLKNINNQNFTSAYLISLYSIINSAGLGKICDPLNYYIDKDIFKNNKLIFDYSEDYENYKLDLNKPNPLCNKSYQEYLQTYICDPLNYYIDKDIFKNNKLIFDYSEDYENYKLDLNKPNPLCNKSYQEYLQTYVNKYNILYGYCKVEGHNDSYCTEFNKHFSKKEHNLLSTWSCNLEGTKLKVKLIGDGHGEEEEKVQMERSSTGGSRQEKLKEIERVGGALGAELKEKKVEGRAQAEHAVLTSHPPLGTESPVMSSSSEVADSSSISTTSKYIANVASVAGIVIPSYLVYNVINIGIEKIYNNLHLIKFVHFLMKSQITCKIYIYIFYSDNIIHNFDL